MSSIIKDRTTVTCISLDKSIRLTSPYTTNKRILLQIKEKLQPSQSMKGMRKCYSLTKYSKKSSGKRTLDFLETPKATSSSKYNRANYVFNKGCQLSDLFKKDFKPIIKNSSSKAPHTYLPLMKSPYKLIEELKSAVDKVTRYTSNGSLIHQLRSDYYVNRMNQENSALQNRIMKRRRAAKSKEEEDEEKDKVVLDDPEEQRLKQAIRSFLGAKDSKFNQAIEVKSDSFFSHLDNRVNFGEDVYLVPLLMCKLNKYPVTRSNQIEYFNIKNNIGPGILRYLYSLRVCIQREKDQHEKGTRRRKKKLAFVMRNEEKEEEGDAKDKESVDESIYFNSSSASASPFYQCDAKNDYLQLMKAVNNPFNGLNIYEVEDFFIHKYIRYEHIQVASDRHKEFILNQFSNLSFRKYQQRHIPKLIASLQ